MHDAVPDKLGVLEARNHGEDPLLLPPLEVGLEAHDVVEGALQILGPQLDVGPGAVAGAGVGETYRAQGAIPHGIRPPGRHDLDGHAALVDRDGVSLFAVGVRVGLGLLGPLVEVVQGGPLGRSQGLIERLVFCLVKGAVQVVGLPPAIAGGGKDLVVVQALGGDDGGHCVIKMQPLVPGQPADLVGQSPLGQGSGGHQHRLGLVDGGDLLPVNGNPRALADHPGNLGAEHVPVHRQSAARRHPGGLGGLQELAAHPAHLLFQQAGSGIQPLGFQAVGADQLGEALAFMGRGEVDRFLLVEVHPDPLARQPEGRLAARQARAQDFDMKLCLIHSFHPLFLGTGISKPQPSLAQ